MWGGGVASDDGLSSKPSTKELSVKFFIHKKKQFKSSITRIKCQITISWRLNWTRQWFGRRYLKECDQFPIIPNQQYHGAPVSLHNVVCLKTRINRVCNEQVRALSRKYSPEEILMQSHERFSHNNLFSYGKKETVYRYFGLNEFLRSFRF